MSIIETNAYLPHLKDCRRIKLYWVWYLCYQADCAC